MRSQGYSPFKIAAMIYRHGYLDGKESQREKVKEAYKRLYDRSNPTQPDTTSPPEATADIVLQQEGSISNEQ